MTNIGIKVVCKCSCVTYFNSKRDKLICRWCGNKIYRDEKTEFKEKLMKAMRKV